MMQKNGQWDNSDVQSAQRLPWLRKDKEYAAGGYRKEQSASILSSGPGFDWTGQQDRTPTNNKRSMPWLS